MKDKKQKYQISLYLTNINYNKLQEIIKKEKINGNRSYSATQFINNYLASLGKN